MCIRDRRNAVSGAAGKMGVEGAEEVFEIGTPAIHKIGMQPLRQRRWQTPVSYTHLRAHETVLDLVCRLLLEKKKTHPTTIHTTYNVNQA